MGSTSSTPVKDKQTFTLKTQAKLVSEATIGTQEIKKAHVYLTSPAFKKRVISDLNANFVDDKKIKIFVDSLKVQNDLTVLIQGTIKVLKKESEEERLVKDGLETVLPHSAAGGEPMPPRQKFQIRFETGKTSVVF
jgi:hypothetical protein